MTSKKPNIAAVLETPKSVVTIKERPIPSPGPDEILVLNKAIATNPAEWRIQDFDFLVTKYPNVLGSDVCDIVLVVGESVIRFKKDDRVCGILREIGTTRIPDSMSFEEGSVLLMAFATPGMALLDRLDLPRPSIAEQNRIDGAALLVWGASSSVGTAALQIAKAIGIKTYAVCSE